jgi:hypothetical protein
VPDNATQTVLEAGTPPVRAKEGSMAKIIQFPLPAEHSIDRSTKGMAPLAHTESAEIIIFPGVRIERFAAISDRTHTVSSAKTRR